jgi:vitamin B12 transporter
LYYPGSGNADLKAETSLNREVGLRIDFSSVNLDISVFRNELTNKIAWAPAPTADNPFRWTPFNIDRARYQGVEFSTGFETFGFSNNLNFSYIDAQKYETNDLASSQFSKLPYVSNKLARYSVAKQWQSIDFTLSVAYQSAQQTNSSELLPSQVSWDVAANYYIQPELVVTARIDNLFDQQTTPSEGYGVDVDGDWVNDEFYNYNGSGREIFVGLSYQF